MFALGKEKGRKTERPVPKDWAKEILFLREKEWTRGCRLCNSPFNKRMLTSMSAWLFPTSNSAVRNTKRLSVKRRGFFLDNDVDDVRWLCVCDAKKGQQTLQRGIDTMKDPMPMGLAVMEWNRKQSVEDEAVAGPFFVCCRSSCLSKCPVAA